MGFKNKWMQYREDSSPLLEQVYHEQKIKAESIGQVPVELLDNFFAIARKGKRLRGFLTVLGYELAGGRARNKILKASLVPEIFHAGVLVDDDVMDEAELRRGQQTIHHLYNRRGRSGVYGTAMAICAADLAYYISWQVLLETKFAEKMLVEAGRVYADHVVRLIHGQVLDVNSGQGGRLSNNEIMQIVWIKSGDYSAWMPLQLGMTLAGMTQAKLMRGVKDFATCLGMAFQLRDDWLGSFGQSEKTGKPALTDLREGKQTLLVWHLRKYGTKRQVQYLESVLGKPVGEREAEKLKQIYQSVGSRAYLEGKINEYAVRGQREIQTLAAKPATKQVLSELLVYTAQREK